MGNIQVDILDFYDDAGASLKQVVRDPSEIPDFVKTASAVGQQAHNNQYALVLIDDGHVLKKFATADSGNTWLSTLYFGLHRAKLPEEAQKVAAANLIEACELHDIEAPDFLWDVAEGAPLGNVVDITGLRPPIVKEAAAADDDYAIERADGSQYFPLRDAVDVQTAMEYFEDHAEQFVPRERREYAVKVAAKAAHGSLPLSEKIASYAGDQYNPAVEGHLSERLIRLDDAGAPKEMKQRLVKLAKARRQTEPEAFAALLESFDRDAELQALWDREIVDPWAATFAVKSAAAQRPRVFQAGELEVSLAELEKLASSDRIQSMFGTVFARTFEVDPAAHFEALPLLGRRALAQMAVAERD